MMKKVPAFALLCCLFCLSAAPSPVQAQATPNYHSTVLFFTDSTTVDNPQTGTFTFYNTFLSDPSEYHIIYIFAAGSGNVSISLAPADLLAEVYYAAVGFLGLRPLYGIGAYGSSIAVSAPVPFFGFGMLFVASHTAPSVLGVNYPATFTVEAYFSDTPASQP